MTTSEITQAVVMRCRGISYMAIGEFLGRSGITIHRNLCPAKRNKHNDHGAKWRKANPARLKESYAKSRKKRIAEDPEYHKKQYRNNRKNRIKAVQKHYETNKKEILRKKNERDKARKLVDPQFRISCNLRTRLHKILNRNQKAGSAVRDLGCSVSELKSKLERMFYDRDSGEKMSWENYGSGWHIDHIKPLTTFDLTNREQFLQACNFSNLQPLWSEDNLAKGSNYDD